MSKLSNLRFWEKMVQVAFAIVYISIWSIKDGESHAKYDSRYKYPVFSHKMKAAKILGVGRVRVKDGSVIWFELVCFSSTMSLVYIII